MPFDNFDKKVKEAAEQHHPAYDENAWRKMETLLNEHLPQQKSRRRFFLLLFTLLVIGGGAYFFLSNPRAKNSDLAVEQNNGSTSSKPQADQTDKNTTVILPSIDKANRKIDNDNNQTGAPTKIVDKGDNILDVNRQNRIINRQLGQKVGKTKPVLNDNTVGDRNTDIGVSQPEKKTDENLKSPVTSNVNENMTKNETTINTPVTKANDAANNTQQLQSPAATKTTPKKGSPDRLHGLSFFVSHGADMRK